MKASSLIEIKDLGLRYAENWAFKGINFDIPEKQVTALIGPSGCGKSSLLYCLNRMIETESQAVMNGQVLFKNIDIQEYKIADLRKKIGLIFQKPTVFPFSIEKNFKIPLLESQHKQQEPWQETMEISLKKVGLWSEVKDRLKRPANELSGGQKQRLCIARSLSLSPEVLLMDEPCSALDPISTGLIEDLIAELSSDYTIMVVTHNLAQARRVSQDSVFICCSEDYGELKEINRTAQFFTEPRSLEAKKYIYSERF